MASISPDGRQIAVLNFVDHPESTWVDDPEPVAIGMIDVASGERDRAWVGPRGGWGAESAVRWSPDGAFIAVAFNQWMEERKDVYRATVVVDQGGQLHHHFLDYTIPRSNGAWLDERRLMLAGGYDGWHLGIADITAANRRIVGSTSGIPLAVIGDRVVVRAPATPEIRRGCKPVAGGYPIRRASRPSSPAGLVEASRIRSVYPGLVLDLDRVDLEEIAGALADQSAHEYRWLIDPHTGEITFWTADTGIDGHNPVDLDELDHLVCVDPLPSHVWYQDMVDFAEQISDGAAGRRLAHAIDGRGAFGRFKKELHEGYPHLVPAWHAFRDNRARRRAVEWLADQSLIDHETASHYLATHPDADLP